MHDVKNFFWDEITCFVDGIIHFCVHKDKILTILEVCHSFLLVGIVVVFALHIKFCSVDLTGLPSTMMLMILISRVTIAINKEEFQRGKSFL